MSFLNTLLTLFLWPGTFVTTSLGLDPETDGGILRSFINMMVWGVLSFAIIMPILL